MASLIRLSRGKVPSRAIQFTDPQGDRRTIHLGKVGLEAAREFKRKVEKLLAWSITNDAPDAQTSAWLAGLADPMYAKLAKVGLAAPREPKSSAPGLGAWLDKFLAERVDLKPSSRKNVTRTADLLKEHFGESVPIDAITLDAAKEWRSWLASRKLAEATIRLHCRNAKAVINEAVERELIERNPFRKLVSTAIAADRDRYVAPDEADRILEACPNVQWRTLFGLARFAGLRVPSETHVLTWADVDWQRCRLTARSPKTERYEGRERRVVPIVPKLAEVLREAFEAADEGQQHIITLSRNNLRRNLHVVLERLGIKPWLDAFQTLRRSCETEWSQTFPQHAVSHWLGHSENVSRKHYLLVPDDLYVRAAGLLKKTPQQCAAECAAVGSRIDAQTAAEQPSAADARAEKKRASTTARADRKLATHDDITPYRNATPDISDWARLDSNQRPDDYESPALTAELRAPSQ